MHSLRPLASIPKHCSVRSLTCSAYRSASNKLDASGRSPGFARRRSPSRQPQQPPASNSPSSSSSSSSSSSESTQGKNVQLSNALQRASANDSNGLLAPVHIPEDRHGVLNSSHPSASILANSSIVVQRQLEMMNVLMGFEQANRYVLMDSTGNHIGFLAEQEHGLGNAIARQTFRTHRSFTTHVFDKHEKEVLRFHRPFSWISSKIKVYDALNPEHNSYSTSTALQGTSAGSITNQTSASISDLALADMRVIGEAQQQWAPLRRRYNLFLHRDLSHTDMPSNHPQLSSPEMPPPETKALQVSESAVQGHGFAQFAYVSEPFLSWDFSLLSENGQLIGSVNRNFAGFAREIFTDTGVYALRMDAASLAAEPRHLISQTGHSAQSLKQEEQNITAMTLDQRAVMLATAVSIDFDYFSRHSGAHHSGWMPMWIPWGGGATEAAGAEAGAAGAAGAAAGEAGAVEGGAAAEAGLSEAGRAARGAQEAARGYGSGEGALAGAGTMAGYEAMQRGREQQQQQSPTQDQQQQQPQQNDENDWWGGGKQDDDDPWGGGKGGSGGDGDAGGGDSGGGGGDGLDLGDWF